MAGFPRRRDGTGFGAGRGILGMARATGCGPAIGGGVCGLCSFLAAARFGRNPTPGRAAERARLLKFAETTDKKLKNKLINWSFEKKRVNLRALPPCMPSRICAGEGEAGRRKDDRRRFRPQSGTSEIANILNQNINFNFYSL